MAHPKGYSLLSIDNKDDACEFLQAVANTGDCGFEERGGGFFHGTSPQRQCAAIFGMNLAKESDMTIMEPSEVLAQYDQVQAQVAAGDPDICPNPCKDDNTGNNDTTLDPANTEIFDSIADSGSSSVLPAGFLILVFDWFLLVFAADHLS